MRRLLRVIRLSLAIAVITRAVLAFRRKQAEQNARGGPAPGAGQQTAPLRAQIRLDDDQIDEAGRESFPASDPPALNFGRGW